MPVELLLLTPGLFDARVLESVRGVLLPQGSIMSYRQGELHQFLDEHDHTVLTVFACKTCEQPVQQLLPLIADPVQDPAVLAAWSEVLLPDHAQPGAHDQALRILSGIASATSGEIHVRA